MDLSDFYGEERCMDLYYNDSNFGWLGYVNHNTPEIKEDYVAFCKENGLDEGLESSADRFITNREELFEKSLKD